MAKVFSFSRIKEFFTSSSSGGFILLTCVVISLTIANSGLGEGYEALLGTQIGRDFGSIHLRYSLLMWINDGLMAIFFLLFGLEINREIYEGELSSPEIAALLLIASIVV